MRSIKYDGVKVTRLGIDKFKMLCFEYCFFFNFWVLRCDILGDRGSKVLRNQSRKTLPSN